MAGGKQKGVKKQKIEDETVEKLIILEAEIDDRVEQQMNIFKDRVAVRRRLKEAYEKDLQNFFSENPELGSMTLVEYVQTMRGKENTKAKIEEETKKVPVEEKKTDMPSVIRPKKTAFRHARPNEVVFSANGTPITFELQPKSFIRNFTAVAQVLSTPGTRSVSLAMEELSEMD